MSWQKKPGPEHDHIDGRTLVHNIHLFNDVTGAEHNLHLLLKTDSCAVCKRPFPKASLEILAPKAAIADALKMLNENHAAILAYAKAHGVPILVGPLASSVPDGHKLITTAGRKTLLPPRK